MNPRQKDNQIESLLAAVVRLGASPGQILSGGKWWVFTSIAVSGEVVFTIKRTEGISPGGGWDEIPQARLDAFLVRELTDQTWEVRAGTPVGATRSTYYAPPARLGVKP